jgi:Asp-tRNA(Asn)/Glu-tRNA(Gln) amidotransferase B subunit
VEAILTPEGMKAYGQYHKQLIKLAQNIKEGTASHELLHAVFELIDADTRTFLLSEIMKEEGISAAQAEEKLADMFSDYFRTGKIGNPPKSTWGKLKQFFKKVNRFIH